MSLRSPVFEDMQFFSEHYTCDRDGLNPPLEILNVPENTQSLALVMDDLDSADEGVTNHWILFNISPKTSKIEENSIPQGAIEGKNDLGTIGYAPPCPMAGVHRYEFTVYALDKKLDFEEGAIKDNIENEIEDSIIDSATITGLFKRSEIVDDNFEY